MNARQVQAMLYQQRRACYSVLLPNYTPDGWGFECDVFAVTKAGLFHEFEIKLTKADFERDAVKAVDEKTGDGRYVWNTSGIQRRTKYERLQSRDVRGPARFWYLMPDEMVPVEAVPAFAGIITIRCTSRRGEHESNGSMWLWPKVIRPAPKLHAVHVDSRIARHALSVCYDRYWIERRRVDKLAKTNTLVEAPEGALPAVEDDV